MTLAGWLDARRPVPPPALRERIRLALAESLDGDERHAFDACLSAGERVVASLLRENATSRDTAIDLLAADALVTYAFEAASDQPAELSSRASEAMKRIASLADSGRGSIDG